MSNGEKIYNEILNCKQMLNMLIKEIGYLEERCASDAITYEDAIRYSKEWELSIQNQYKMIEMLKNQLFTTK